MDMIPQKLRDLAAEALEQFGNRLHQVPVQDLPLCAKILTDMADKVEAADKAGETSEPADTKPQTGKGKAQ